MRTTSPEAVGLSSQRLDRIAPAMQDFIDKGLCAGLATLVVRRGQLVHFNTVGYQDKDANIPLRDDTIYRIYSMTKPITSIALMQLYEQGKFLLNDPVSKFIPVFGETKVYDGMTPTGIKLVDQSPRMTIHHLLTHTSGLTYGSRYDTPIEEMYRQMGRMNPEHTFETLTGKLAAIPLVFQPGTNWLYSVATDVCGYLVELISGVPFATYLEENIFKPLGMVDTHFTLPGDKVDRLSAIYAHDSNGNLVSLEPSLENRVRDYTIPTKSPSGGGGLVSTISDYMNFCTLLINKGVFDGERILGRKTIDYMSRNHLPSHFPPDALGTERPGLGFGLGFRVVLNAALSGLMGSDGEYGWSGLADTYFWIDPQEDLFGIFMNQYMKVDDRPKAREIFQTLVYQALVN